MVTGNPGMHYVQKLRQTECLFQGNQSAGRWSQVPSQCWRQDFNLLRIVFLKVQFRSLVSELPGVLVKMLILGNSPRLAKLASLRVGLENLQVPQMILTSMNLNCLFLGAGAGKSKEQAKSQGRCQKLGSQHLGLENSLLWGTAVLCLVQCLAAFLVCNPVDASSTPSPSCHNQTLCNVP